jgi:hypothetical protein
LMQGNSLANAKDTDIGSHICATAACLLLLIIDFAA